VPPRRVNGRGRGQPEKEVGMGSVAGSKRCAKCGVEKGAEEYHARDKRTGRLPGRCRACHLKACRERYYKDLDANRAAKREASRKCYLKHQEYWKKWRAANRDKVHEYDRRWTARNMDKCRAKWAKWRAKWEAENKDKRVASRARWAAENKDKRDASRARWAAENVERTRMYKSKRRAKVCAAADQYTLKEWFWLKVCCGRVCLMCGRPETDGELCFDHIVPLSRGGGNGIDNGQPLCRSCNSIKGVKSTDLRPPHIKALFARR
jgi:5-methylcytosine-specific restriction endonuclease McrA